MDAKYIIRREKFTIYYDNKAVWQEIARRNLEHPHGSPGFIQFVIIALENAGYVVREIITHKYVELVVLSQSEYRPVEYVASLADRVEYFDAQPVRNDLYAIIYLSLIPE